MKKKTREYVEGGKKSKRLDERKNAGWKTGWLRSGFVLRFDFHREVTDRYSTPGMISTTSARGAKLPLILTIVYETNQADGIIAVVRRTPDEMIMIGCHKFPVSLSSRFLSPPFLFLLAAPRCHLRNHGHRTLRIDLANFYKSLSLPVARFLPPFRDEEDFYRWLKLLTRIVDYRFQQFRDLPRG